VPGTRVVSKVVKKHEVASELATMKYLKAIDPQGKYTAQFLGVCDAALGASLAADGCVRTKFADPRTGALQPMTMISMAAAGRPLADDFEDAMRRGTLEAAVKRAVGAFASLVRALAFVHSRGVFHIDINSGNMLVDGSGLGRFIDFGGAQNIEYLVGRRYQKDMPLYLNPFDGVVIGTMMLARRLVMPAAGVNPMDNLAVSPPLAPASLISTQNQYVEWYIFNT
jgi:hypothetical protein